MATIHIPLDAEFNRAITGMVGFLLPGGFEVADDAPSTYEQLCAHLGDGRRMRVWSGGSQATIYGEAHINHAFRAWHDLCHYAGGFVFDLAGESAAAALQCRQLTAFYGDNAATRRWCRLIDAEVNGQARFFERHGRFPLDQARFVMAYLADADTALATAR